MTRESVAQIVKPEILDADIRERLVEAAIHIVKRDDVAVPVEAGKHEFFVLDPGSMLRQLVQQNRVNRQAPGLAILCIRQKYCFSLPVDMLPLESEDLPLPHSSVERHDDRGVEILPGFPGRGLQRVRLEIKDVQYLYRTTQVATYIADAQAEGTPLYIMVSPSTQVAGTVAAGVAETGGEIAVADVATGTVVSLATGETLLDILPFLILL